MEKVALLLAVEHLRRGKAIQIMGERYVAERKPLNTALCVECPMLGAKADGECLQTSLCMLCVFLDWSERKQPYRVRLKKIEKDLRNNIE